LTTQDGASTSAITGVAIDRDGFQSAIMNLQALLTNAQSDKSISVTYSVQVKDSADSAGDYAEYGDAQTVTITAVTTGAADVTETKISKLGINLRGAKRYIKLVVTPDDTEGTVVAATGDTEVFGVNVVLAGADNKPTD
jgi:hypothetical protein